MRTQEHSLRRKNTHTQELGNENRAKQEDDRKHHDDHAHTCACLELIMGLHQLLENVQALSMPRFDILGGDQGSAYFFQPSAFCGALVAGFGFPCGGETDT